MPGICEFVPQKIMASLQDAFTIHPFGTGFMVVTPFLHFDMSFIEIYVEPTKSGYLLSDGGETLNMLFVSGITIEENMELMKHAEQIALKHGVLFNNSALLAQATEETIGFVIDRLIHTIQAIGFFIYRRSHQRRSTFRDEVEESLMEYRVVYIPDYTIRGYGKTHKIDFYINSGRNILLDVLSASTVTSARNKIDEVAFKKLDLQRAMVPHQFILAIDDRKRESSWFWNDERVKEEIAAYFEDSAVWWSKEQSRLIAFLTAPIGDTQQRIS